MSQAVEPLMVSRARRGIMDRSIFESHTYHDLCLLSCIAISFLSLCQNVYPFLDKLKYVPVLYSAVYVVCLVVRRRPVLLDRRNGPSIFFAVLALFATISIGFWHTYYAFIDFCIYFGLAAVSVAIYRSNIRVTELFISFCGGAALWLVTEFVHAGSASEIYELFTYQNSALKYSLVCYSFGIFAIYFWFYKRIFLCALSFAGVLLAFKRASLVALVLVALLHLVPKRVQKVLTTKWAVLALNGSWLAMSTFIASDHFASLVQNQLGISADFFTMGRHTIYGIGLELLRQPIQLFGCGLGRAYTVLSSALDGSMFAIGDKVLLHNEILRFYIELGLVPLALLVVLLYPRRSRFTSNRRFSLCFSIVLFLNLVAFFDNLFLYSLCWYVAIVVVNAVLLEERHEAASPHMLSPTKM